VLLSLQLTLLSLLAATVAAHAAVAACCYCCCSRCLLLLLLLLTANKKVCSAYIYRQHRKKAADLYRNTFTKLDFIKSRSLPINSTLKIMQEIPFVFLEIRGPRKISPNIFHAPLDLPHAVHACKEGALHALHEEAALHERKVHQSRIK